MKGAFGCRDSHAQEGDNTQRWQSRESTIKMKAEIGAVHR